MNVYPIRRWVFDDAHGRYDIDLGSSYIECGDLRDLAVPRELLLDYGSDRGGDHLRGLVGEIYGRDHTDVTITHGAQEALYLLYRTMLAAGDHVVVFAPGWQQAWDVPGLVGCRVDVVGSTEDGAPDVATALRHIGPATRVVVVNSPCNPTGLRMSPADARALVNAARASRAYLVLDEEYVADLSSASLLGCYERAVSVSGVSKVYGLPGLRVGWMCGPEDVVDAAARYKHYTTISNSVLMEQLTARVLEARAAHLERYRGLVSRGLAVLAAWVELQNGALRMTEPDDTPFAWLRLADGRSSLQFCRTVLERARTLLVPAEVFGAESGFRLTFARDPNELRRGLGRIGQLL